MSKPTWSNRNAWAVVNFILSTCSTVVKEVIFYISIYICMDFLGLALWSSLNHLLFHTTQIEKEIFYHQCCPSFKPNNHNYVQALRVIHHRPLLSHLWAEGRLLTSFLNSELTDHGKHWKREGSSAWWLSSLYSYKMLIMRGRWPRGFGCVHRKVWTPARKLPSKHAHINSPHWWCSAFKMCVSVCGSDGGAVR